MFCKKPTLEIDANACLSNSIRLPDSSVTKALRPVTLAPGRASVSITSIPRGSPIHTSRWELSPSRPLLPWPPACLAWRSSRPSTERVRQRGPEIVRPVRRTNDIRSETLFLDIAALAKTEPQRTEVCRVRRRRKGFQNADPVDPVRLRNRGKRKSESRASHCKDELPPPHAIPPSERFAEPPGAGYHEVMRKKQRS